MTISFGEKVFVILIYGSLVGLCLLFLMILICTIFSPSCEELGGTKVFAGHQRVLIGKVPVNQEKYECIFEEKK